ncbi:hypothetical protein BIV57_00605 [Mangrovactinospora gilvigrisea]|uniref:Uncharacterized protein n=1 Tax=Mangrovactinospora gilvigrisea TaxID=1428644 RepID=A0A1J7CIB6_9ACTN|nr:hypothetical protein BIV57_00605 [Mangrovactinospora gilvigrisea]
MKALPGEEPLPAAHTTELHWFVSGGPAPAQEAADQASTAPRQRTTRYLLRTRLITVQAQKDRSDSGETAQAGAGPQQQIRTVLHYLLGRRATSAARPAAGREQAR